MKIHIVDYGMGNIASVVRAIERLGCRVSTSSEPRHIQDAAKIILPGVGSFTQAMKNLRELGLAIEIRRAVVEHRKPLLGICLGMQLLADLGLEGADEGGTPGLGLIPGRVQRLVPERVAERIPHVGWNRVDIVPNLHSGYLQNIADGIDFYFVHSYFFEPADKSHVLATTPFCGSFPSIVGSGHILGCQFHPEKSSKIGYSVLKNFVDLIIC